MLIVKFYLCCIFLTKKKKTICKKKKKKIKQELSSARLQKSKVLIIGHIPLVTGNDNRPASVLIDYANLIVEFQDVIVGQLFGHTHNDEFQLVSDKNNNNKPISMQYIAPR